MRTEQKKEIVEFEQVIERGCGIDVHKQVIVATVRGSGIKKETRKFTAFTDSLQELKEWLTKLGITHVAMESTGVYWKPVFNILEDSFEILLCNANHIKNVPGHKTDKRDSRWISKLLLSGLLRGSFIPKRPFRELRDLIRYERKLKEQIASEKNRIQKIFEDTNVKLSCVVSDMDGATATKIIDALISGQEDPKELVKYRHGKSQKTIDEFLKALKGKLTEHHRFMLRTIKLSISEKEKIIDILQEEINKKLEENQLMVDYELLQTIPGVGEEGAAIILAEIGNDMSQFPDEKHLASWAGLCPGVNESAGKKKVVE